MKSHDERFPPRNRIIAGLSAAVIVVEAARTGGALITAVKAAEFGIPVFAMPGDVDRTTSEGVNGHLRVSHLIFPWGWCRLSFRGLVCEMSAQRRNPP